MFIVACNYILNLDANILFCFATIEIITSVHRADQSVATKFNALFHLIDEALKSHSNNFQISI